MSLPKFAAFSFLALALAGCISPDTSKPVQLPPDVIVLGIGQPDTLTFPAYRAGTIFFTDDQSGQVVWATTIPNLTEPRLAFEANKLPHGLHPDRSYRMYYTPNLPPAYTEFQ